MKTKLVSVSDLVYDHAIVVVGQVVGYMSVKVRGHVRNQVYARVYDQVLGNL